MSYYQSFTSESVCAGHPDKICDQVSDAVLDEALRLDTNARVAVETLVTSNRIILAGEVSCRAKIDYQAIARRTIKKLGYDSELYHFNSETTPVEIYIHSQSRDIACGVDDGGAGDQGLMFGFACRQTPQLMPLPIVLAHELARRIDTVRDSEELGYLRPDGKTQVTVGYRNGKPVSVERVVVAVPHDPVVELEQVTGDIRKQVIGPVLEKYAMRVRQKDVIVNGTGVWEIGGPHSDTGLTGRKIIVDTYGGYARHGGGCFSGKDPSKVDRSGAYACRYLAKRAVHQGLVDQIEVRVAYAIGQARPVDLGFDCFGTAKVSDREIRNFLRKSLDMSVNGIINGLSLREPIYEKTAVYGHFGRPGFPWEKCS